MLIEKINACMNTINKNICISFPRRFGKTIDANMLVAYYSKGCDSSSLFERLKIASSDSYLKHLNQHNVIHLNMQYFLSKNIEEMLRIISNEILFDLSKAYHAYCTDDLSLSLD